MRILLVGDVMLGRLVNDVLKAKPPEYPWGDTLPIFDSADVRICNLECVISDKGQPWSLTPKVFHFRSDAKNIGVLKAANIDGVSLANNHALDYEYEAMFEMLKSLHKANISFAGAGKDRYQASMPAAVKKDRATVGLIAFTDNEPGWQARKSRPGVFYMPIDVDDHRAQALLKLVEQTKRRVDYLIVSAHWGGNWGYDPPPEHISFAQALIDGGADIIFGHSAHVFRGIEIYKGKPIIYSAGDFIDDYAVDETERNDESFIFMVEFEGSQTRQLQLYPTMIADFQARLAGERALAVAAKMSHLCQALGTKPQWTSKTSCLTITIKA